MIVIIIVLNWFYIKKKASTRVKLNAHKCTLFTQWCVTWRLWYVKNTSASLWPNKLLPEVRWLVFTYCVVGRFFINCDWLLLMCHVATEVTVIRCFPCVRLWYKQIVIMYIWTTLVWLLPRIRQIFCYYVSNESRFYHFLWIWNDCCRFCSVTEYQVQVAWISKLNVAADCSFSQVKQVLCNCANLQTLEYMSEALRCQLYECVQGKLCCCDHTYFMWHYNSGIPPLLVWNQYSWNIPIFCTVVALDVGTVQIQWKTTAKSHTVPKDYFEYRWARPFV